MRRLYWYLTGYIKKHGWIVVISLIIGIILFSFIVPGIAPFIISKPRHYIGIVGEHTLTSLPEDIKQEISVGLTSIGLDRTVQPLLADRWIVEDDGKTYRFLLKKDVVWQDGMPVTPETIKYQFNDVETIATPNDVLFKLPEIFAPFPSVVREPIIRYGKTKDWGLFQRSTILGIGPNKVIDYKLNGNRLTQIEIDTPESRKIYRFFLTQGDAMTAFKKGEVDILPDVNNVLPVLDWKTVKISSLVQTNRYLAVFFNNNHPAMLKNVRQAFAYAVTKPSDSLRALGPVDPKSWAYLEGGKGYDFDLQRGVDRLLDDIPGVALTLELMTTIEYQDRAELIKTQLETLGDQAVSACQTSKAISNKTSCQNLDIAINIRVTNFPDTSNFELLLIGQESPSDPDQYFLWHSEQPTNFTHYKNTRIDSLLEKGRRTLDQNERLAIYQEFQQFLLEDPPAIFLEHLQSYRVERQ